MLKAGFVLLAIVMAVILLAGAASIAGKTFADRGKQKRFKLITALVLVGWLAYVTLISLPGIFEVPSTPPRIPLLLVLPAFAVIACFFTFGRSRSIIEQTPVSWPVYIQSFRILVELLIWGSVVAGILPRAASFEGYNYDIVIGITAPIVGYFFAEKGKNRIAVIVWNCAGLFTLTIVSFILISHAYFFSMWGLQDSILAKGCGLFPFTLLAGFFMPLAVFMHVFSIVKIIRMKASSKH